MSHSCYSSKFAGCTACKTDRMVHENMANSHTLILPVPAATVNAGNFQNITETQASSKHLLSSPVNASLSLVSSSMACLLVLLLSISSSPHCLLLFLRGQPDDGSQRQLLPVLFLQPPSILLNSLFKKSVMQAGCHCTDCDNRVYPQLALLFVLCQCKTTHK